MKSIMRVVLAGVIGMRAVTFAVMFSNIVNPKGPRYYLLEGYTHLSLGLACGLGGLSAVVARGLDRDAGFRFLLSQGQRTAAEAEPKQHKKGSYSRLSCYLWSLLSASSFTLGLVNVGAD
ncbi:hypothetical protein B296_00045758 [Ensete ventricosum]|uniref:Uncharacterized protein n=1 Tax=Ensete ventricosum TaxID=4639 RepID=A0A426Z699_ENSVE|nr:hypothetical protein B296_00045758 [Ensete ventricosum]